MLHQITHAESPSAEFDQKRAITVRHNGKIGRGWFALDDIGLAKTVASMLLLVHVPINEKRH